MWREVQKRGFFNLEKLADFLELDEEKRNALLYNPNFKLNIPYRLAAKIQKNTLDDPLLKQFVPLREELVEKPHLKEDPVQDTTFRRANKLLHKYEGRALLVTTSACAMHCRYCFRKNFPYEKEDKSFAQEIDIIRKDSSIEEIILSGGDPLSLSNSILQKLFDDLTSIPHLKRIRFHSRFPIGIPERIDNEFLSLLQSTHLQIWFVLHCNHAVELDEEVLLALRKVQKLGIPVLNQSVLLKGVNDTATSLKSLLETLINAGIMPYYLHKLDPVHGTSHFEVLDSQGHSLLETLAKELPGFAIPKFVQEIPGKPHKTVV